MKKTLIAMILVGGAGSRLQEITKDTAKPAVSFGAKYRLIDFTLSNITNSNIDVVGVVTQYEPYDLMNYIGSGASWDLDVTDGGISFLTPYARSGGVLWQKGTAHAIKQYFRFVKEFDADYVLILSGDQVYKMDYQKLFEHHLTHNAEITIAATNINAKEASRFGILELDSNGYVIGFEEKPDSPKSNLASMGLYLFNTDTLEALLSGASAEDEVDFGKNIIPKSIKQKKQVSAYIFKGYWKDVGTVESLFEANMDMIDDPEFLSLNLSKNLPVYSKSLNLPPHICLESAHVRNSVIADGSVINGRLIHSSAGYETVIEKNASVENCVLLPGVVVSKGASIKNLIVNRNTVIPENYHLEALTITLLDKDNLERLGEING